MTGERRYKAFISYSHSDEAWARWLQRALEGYRLPKTLRQSHPELPVRLFPIFRDRDELASGGDLSESIRKAMDDSEALIVICSPAARTSQWVNEEIRRFRASGRGDRIFCFMVAGSPDPKSPDCAFPTTILQDEHGNVIHEPLAADATHAGDGKRNAMLKIAAGLLDVGVDDLKRRDAQRQARFWSIVAGGALIIAVLTIGLAIYALDAKRESEIRRSQAENLIGFMLGDLRKNLEPIGKLQLLDSVGDQAMAYFAAIGEKGTEKEMLERAKALKQIGDVRFNQGELEPALRAFRQALTQTKALYESNRANNDYLFELGQAEFWVGYVAWQRGDLEQAQQSMSKYMEYSERLSGRAPDNADYRLELAYAYSNIGSVSLAQGLPEKALEQFVASEKIGIEVLKASPEDSALRMNLSDTQSWIGSTLLELGRLDDSLAAFDSAADTILELHQSGNDKRATEAYARMLRFQAEILLHEGNIDASTRLQNQAIAIYRSLIVNDPSNAAWEYQYLSEELRRISKTPPALWTDDIRADIDRIENRINAMREKDPTSTDLYETLNVLSRLQAIDFLSRNKPEQALEFTRARLAQWRSFIDKKTLTAEQLNMDIQLSETLGLCHAAVGDQGQAAAIWRENAARLDSRKQNNLALLATRQSLAVNLGDSKSASALAELLDKAGFRDPRMDPTYTLSGKFR